MLHMLSDMVVFGINGWFASLKLYSKFQKRFGNSDPPTHKWLCISVLSRILSCNFRTYLTRTLNFYALLRLYDLEKIGLHFLNLYANFKRFRPVQCSVRNFWYPSARKSWLLVPDKQSSYISWIPAHSTIFTLMSLASSRNKHCWRWSFDILFHFVIEDLVTFLWKWIPRSQKPWV